MAWHIPLALGGPVLHWELVRGARQRWLHLLPCCYAIWLIVQGLSLYSSYCSTIAVLMTSRERKELLDCHEILLQAELTRRLSPDEQMSSREFRELDRLPTLELEKRKYHARAAFCRDHFLLVL